MPTNLNIKMKLVAVGRYKLPKQTQEKVEELNNRTLGKRGTAKHLHCSRNQAQIIFPIKFICPSKNN